METCLPILTFLLLLLVVYQGWQIKQLIRKGVDGDETANIEDLLQKLGNMTTQIKGFIK